MQNPSVDEILSFMSKKLGGEKNVPSAIVYAKSVAPELIYHVAYSSKNSVGDENSRFNLSCRSACYERYRVYQNTA